MQNFRQVFQFKNIAVCDLLNNPDKYPLLKDGIKNFNAGMPGIIQKCPYKVKKKKILMVNNDIILSYNRN